MTDITEAINLVCDNEDNEGYFRPYLQLYATDTVVLTETKKQLKAALNSMYFYCQTWKLEVNHSKTKVVIFSEKKIREEPVFTYNGKVIAVEENLFI